MPERNFTWDNASGRYRDGSGRYVPATKVRAALDGALATASNRVNQLSQSMRDGNISLRQWQTAMRTEMKNIHLYSAAAVKGGWAQVTPSDYGRVGQRLREQYKFLDKFASDVSSGRTPLDGRFLQRAALYGQAGRQTYHLVERADKEARGYTEERSILGPADHCEECISEADRGWVPIGDLVPIGSRQCSQNCACEVEYR